MTITSRIYVQSGLVSYLIGAVLLCPVTCIGQLSCCIADGSSFKSQTEQVPQGGCCSHKCSEPEQEEQVPPSEDECCVCFCDGVIPKLQSNDWEELKSIQLHGHIDLLRQRDSALNSMVLSLAPGNGRAIHFPSGHTAQEMCALKSLYLC